MDDTTLAEPDPSAGPATASAAPSAVAAPTSSADTPPARDGRSARWTRHREQRREDLLDVARVLIHERGPDVTMEEIAAASGTSKSIIYRYFSDKNQLQRALGISILSHMHRRLSAEVAALEESRAATDAPVGADDRIRVMVATYIETAQSSPHVYAFITRPSDGLNHFLQNVARMVTRIAPDFLPDKEIWAAGADGFVEGSVDRWMRALAQQDDPEGTDLAGLPTAEELTDHIISWLMKGTNS
jgi:AcrR family transcriptional regulator